jgi:hypothetical protein
MNKFLKSLLLGMLASFLVVGSAVAAPFTSQAFFTDYEYYQLNEVTDAGHGYVGEFLEANDERYFDFDLQNTNPSPGTDSALSFENDVTGYGSPTPLTGISALWAQIVIFSLDNEGEEYDFLITATVDDTVFQLGTSGLWPQYSGEEQYGIMLTMFSDDLLSVWQANPFGKVEISVVDQNGNDFNLVEVGIGVAAVPEPATMMLFGMGLLGLAGITRKRTKA